jgi:tetraacyldisaccharide 4'-kinase
MMDFWYRNSVQSWLLSPLAIVFGWVTWIRRVYLQRIKQTRSHIPIIVVGNLTVGGAGKTPLVIAIANALKQQGIRVGIVSRGYGGKGVFPRKVEMHDKPQDVGDEPLLLRQKTACPVIIAPKRVEAIQYLKRCYQPQVIISDDGLQHYAMGRAIEIVVIDGLRGLGNEWLLPAGPLRERPSRLKQVDFVVVNSADEQRFMQYQKQWLTDVPNHYRMTMNAGDIRSLARQNIIQPADLEQPVAAVAAIGNPKRFYQTLDQLQLAHQPYSFADHYQFKPSDLKLKERNIIMTEKDAVKCISFAADNMYVLAVTAELEPQFWEALLRHPQLRAVLNMGTEGRV